MDDQAMSEDVVLYLQSGRILAKSGDLSMRPLFGRIANFSEKKGFEDSPPKPRRKWADFGRASTQSEMSCTLRATRGSDRTISGRWKTTSDMACYRVLRTMSNIARATVSGPYDGLGLRAWPGTESMRLRTEQRGFCQAAVFDSGSDIVQPHGCFTAI